MAGRRNGNSFDVQLVRKGDGTVVYMECDHDLLAHLSAVLHLPVGAVGLKLADTAPDLGLVKFGSSVASLREAVWHGSKEGMLPSDRPPSNTPIKIQRLVATPVASCFCASGIKMHRTNARQCRLCQRQNEAHYGSAGAGYVTMCSTCGVCEGCTRALYDNARAGVKLADDRAALAVVEKAPKLPQFQNTVKFLVDNELRVWENSSVKALQLLSVAHVNIAEIKTEARRVSVDETRLLLAHMLFNSSTILTSVFTA